MKNRFFIFTAQLIIALLIFTEANKAQKDPSEYNVAIFIYETVEILDFGGPAEVFSAAGCKVYTVSISADPIISQGFIKIVPQYTINNCPKPNIIVIPGGHGQKLEDNPDVQNWIKKCAADAEIVMSVCNGAMFLAKTGILDGKEATSHWGAISRLKSTATKTKIHDDVRFVDNGQVITTAGVSAGIDGSLHVVRKLFGEELALDIAKFMVYDKWDPDAGLIIMSGE